MIVTRGEAVQPCRIARPRAHSGLRAGPSPCRGRSSGRHDALDPEERYERGKVRADESGVDFERVPDGVEHVAGALLEEVFGTATPIGDDALHEPGQGCAETDEADAVDEQQSH